MGGASPWPRVQNQDAASGPTKIEGRNLLVGGLNALAAVICRALGTPLIAATRLRGGNANAARDAAASPPRSSARPGPSMLRAGHRSGGLGNLLRRGPPGWRPVLGRSKHRPEAP